MAVIKPVIETIRLECAYFLLVFVMKLHTVIIPSIIVKVSLIT